MHASSLITPIPLGLIAELIIMGNQLPEDFKQLVVLFATKYPLQKQAIQYLALVARRFAGCQHYSRSFHLPTSPPSIVHLQEIGKYGSARSPWFQFYLAMPLALNSNNLPNLFA